MIKYFLLLFVRNFGRQRLFSAINLAGLSVSMASTLLIYLFVSHELSYDNFHPGADRTYPVNQTFIWGERDEHQFGSTGPGVVFALMEELPEIEMVSRLHTRGDLIVTRVSDGGDVTAFVEKKIVFADSNFFKMFNFPMTKGNPQTALTVPKTVVISESMAQKYFGDEDPIGKFLRIGTSDDRKAEDNGNNGRSPIDYEVSGVVKDRPDNTYVEFDFLVSMSSLPVVTRMSWSWVWTQLETYVRFQEGTDIESIRKRLALIPPKHADQTIRAAMNMTYDEYIKSGKKWDLFLQPLTSIHLPDGIVYNRVAVPGNRMIVYSLIGCAVFILLLSCVNFMNLSMAQFLRRMKEASIRKILGIGRMPLTMQYFGEALSFSLIALLAGLAMAELFLPAFNTLSGKHLSLSFIEAPGLLPAVLALVIIVSLLAGGYPALFLASFHPVDGMKGKLKSGQEGRYLRNGLVVFQFSASIVLILCTAIVYNQLRFVTTKDLGFEQENLVVLNNMEVVRSREALAESVRQLSGVEQVTRATSLPPYVWGGDTFTAAETNGKTFPMNFTTTDEHFIPSLGVKLLLGRGFSADIPADTGRVLLNATAVQRIGWTLDESVIGKKINYDNTTFEVIGVMSDFNYWPLQAEIEPMGVFHMKSARIIGDGAREFLGIRVNAQSPEQWKAMLEGLKKIWISHAADSPFEYQFVNENFNESFKTEQQFGKALTVMAVLAIVIASLGLLGMIVYSLELRTKEIGIRKVSGASAWDILGLISRSYTLLIILAFAIGAPVAWWMMDQWLSGFAYRITPSPWLFVAVGAGTFVIAFTITFYHSLKAALTNPVEVLRNE